MSQPDSTREAEEWSRRRTALIFSGVFLAAILGLSLLQDTQLFLVLLLYGCIFLEGLSISFFVLSFRINQRDRAPEQATEVPRGMDVVSNMRTYVSFASKGSDHSRREIAYLVRNLLWDDHIKKKLELGEDKDLQSDLHKVVYRYTDSRESRDPAKKETKLEREAYVNSLERVLRKLQIP
jgi:hypothetical protein